MCARLKVLKAFIIAAVWSIASGTSAQEQLGDKVLAEYSGEKITLKQLAELQPIVVSWMGVGTTSEHVQTALEDVIFDQVLAKEAEQSGLAKDPEIATQIQRVLAKAYLKVHAPRDQIVVEEEDLQQSYKANLDKYKSQELLQVSHILLKSLEEAQQVEAQLRKGAKFEELATKLSTDRLSALRAGNLGSLQPNQLLPVIRESALALKPGDFSAPVKSSVGYHIIRLEKLPEVQYRPFEDVRQDIYNEIFRQREKQAIDAVKQQLWSKYGVKIDSTAIGAVLKEKTAENVSVVRSDQERQRRNPGEPTELQLVSETIDLGEIDQKKIESFVTVANSSDQPITITRVGSTCPCIEAQAPQAPLKPGEIAQIKFSYDPTLYKEQGTSQRVMFIESSDRLEPRKIVRVQCEVKAK